MQNNKITESWTSIGTILGQPVIDSYTFYLKNIKLKGDIIAAEAKLRGRKSYRCDRLK